MSSSLRTSFLSAAAAAAILLPAAVRAAVPQLEGYNLTWSDDFEGAGGQLPDEALWRMTTGTSYPGGAANFGTGEIQTYTADTANCQLTGNGTLQIKAIKSGSAWTSARIETQLSDFMAEAGGKLWIEGRLSLPDVGENGIGYWPAFWTLGGDFRGTFTNWPQTGEFDIMENVNAKPTTFGTLHCGTNPGGPCQETTGLSGDASPSGKPQGRFHTYSLEVDRTDEGAEAMRWYLDGTQYFEVTEQTIGSDVWAQIAHKGHFILMNLAIGGAFPNGDYGSTTPLENTVSGGVFQAEYVAVYNSI